MIVQIMECIFREVWEFQNKFHFDTIKTLNVIFELIGSRRSVRKLLRNYNILAPN